MTPVTHRPGFSSENSVRRRTPQRPRPDHALGPLLLPIEYSPLQEWCRSERLGWWPAFGAFRAARASKNSQLLPSLFGM